MIPVLYDKTGTNKIGDLIDSIECCVEEERNGIFELTMVYPANTSLLDSICYENIIVVDANDYLKNQKFRIYNTRKLMSNRIEICARHISFDLAHDWIDVLSINNQPCEYVLNMIFKNSQFSSHFKGHSDIVNAQDYAINETTCLSAIGGAEGSIIDTFGTGAEILRDNTDIHVLNRRGSDNDVSIEYRKNLTGLEVEEDTTDLVTRILPYATYTNDNSEEIKVKGAFIDSPLINNYAHPYVKYIDYSGEFDEDNLPTAPKLESLAKKEYINNKVDIPKMNYKIEFIPLSKCAGYEGLEDKINLCDTVTIRDTRYGIDTQSKVIKVTYDALRDRYESMELGEPRTTLGDIVGGTGESTQGPPGPQGPQGPAGADGSIGDFPSTLPEVPTITTKVYGFANVEVSWTFENKVYYSYELYASKTKGFVPNTFNLIFEGQASTFLHQVNPNETWYYRACAINSHGSRTEFSDEVKVSTVKITDLSNYVESAAIGDALIGTLSLERGWVGELKGNYIDAKQLSVTDGNGKRTLDIDSFGNINLDVTTLKINNNTVVTSSEMIQTSKELQLKFTNASYNIIKNGDFENGLSFWEKNLNATCVEDIWNPYDSSMSYVIKAGDQGAGIFQRIKCVTGRTYSWSAKILVERGSAVIGIENYSIVYRPPCGWVTVSGTFEAKVESNSFVIFQGTADTIIHIDKICVNEGEIALPFSKNPSEVYSGITKIDDNGMLIEHSNSNLVSQYTNDGFYIKDKTTNSEFLSATNQGIVAKGGSFKVLDKNNGSTVLWGRDIVINKQRALVGTDNSPETPLIPNKLYINYNHDFVNGVDLYGPVLMTGDVKIDSRPVITENGLSLSTTGYSISQPGIATQWGSVYVPISGGYGERHIAFPLSFVSACFHVSLNILSVDGGKELVSHYTVSAYSPDAHGFYLILKNVDGRNYGTSATVTFFAIGY